MLKTAWMILVGLLWYRVIKLVVICCRRAGLSIDMHAACTSQTAKQNTLLAIAVKR